MTSPKLKFSFTVILLSWVMYTFAQQAAVRNYTVDDGLPSNTIYSLYRDSKGYLWLATDKGIARFNGLTFEILTTQEGLPDNEVFSFREDKEGRLWLATFKGFLSFYKDGIFHTPENTPWLKLPISNTTFIGHWRQAADSSLIAPSAAGDYFVQIKHNKVKLFDIRSIKKKIRRNYSRPNHVIKQNDNRFTIYYNNTAITVDSNARMISEMPAPDNIYYNVGNSSQDQYIYTDDGIMTFNEKGQFWSSRKDVDDPYHLLADSMKKLIYRDHRDILFIGRNRFPLSDRLGGLFDTMYITFGEKDIAGNLWISTRGSGLFRISRFERQIQDLKQAYEGTILTAKKANGKLYFLTSYGNYYLYNNQKLQKLLTVPLQTSAITDKSFLILKNGDLLLIFRNSSRLYKISDQHAIVIPVGRPWSYNSITTKEVLQYGGMIYTSSISNIYRINYDSITNPGTRWLHVIPEREDNDARIYSRAINPADSSFWFSKADGMFKARGKTVTRQDQFRNIIYRIMLFQGGYMLGFTDDNKLLISNDFEKKIKTDTIVEANSIWDNVSPIDNNHLLISTNNYFRLLTLYKPAADGQPRYALQTIEHMTVPLRAEYVVADSNNFYFFKGGSIIKIASSVLFNKAPPPTPLFTALKAGNTDYPLMAEVYIDYSRSKNLNISFDVISFAGKDLTSQYSISKSGQDDWQDITGKEINLNTPGYGTFTIKIRSKTLSSPYSKPAVLIIHVDKPYWATWWFITLLAILALGMIWGIILLITWRRLRKKQREHDADMKYQQSEYKALNALMNPHFIFNSLNNIQGLINKDDKRVANQYLVIFSDLVRQNMHNISKGFISLQEELTLIENYLTLEKLRFKELVNYEIKIGEEVDIEDIMIPPLMVQPLVENAVKHGLLPKQSPQSKVIIRVFEEEDILYIAVEDNGIGLTQSLKNQHKLHESFGLSNLEKRTEHLRKIQQHEINIEVADMKADDGTVTGTKAMVTIRLNQI